MILIIESSADYPSVAISDHQGRIVWDKICLDRQSHSEKLPLLVHEALHFLEDQKYMVCSNIGPLTAVAISHGPGSYTGLRIGTSLAKGLCYSKNIPLISVNGFWGMGNWLLREYSQIEAVFSMLDARREEVYIQRVNRETNSSEKIEIVCGVGNALNTRDVGNAQNPGGVGNSNSDTLETNLPQIEARILNEETLKWMNVMDWSKVAFIGNSNEKALRILNQFEVIQPAIVFSEAPNAYMFGEESAYKLRQGIFEDLAYFEPFYLKDFVPGISTKFKL